MNRAPSFQLYLDSQKSLIEMQPEIGRWRDDIERYQKRKNRNGAPVTSLHTWQLLQYLEETSVAHFDTLFLWVLDQLYKEMKRSKKQRDVSEVVNCGCCKGCGCICWDNE